MANSRNTCVDMRLACVACRCLGGSRASSVASIPFPLLPSVTLALQESHWLLSARTLSYFVHPDPRRRLYPSLYCSYPIQCIELFSEHAEVELSTDFRTHRFPLLCAFAMARNSRSLLDLFDFFARERLKATKEYLSSRCKHTRIFCNKLTLLRINQTFNLHLWKEILHTIKKYQRK